MELEESLRSIKIYDTGEITSKSDEFITYSNIVLNNSYSETKAENICRSEDRAREMVQIIISKINPDLNWMINLDNKMNDSYKKLVDCLGFILNEIELQKSSLQNKILNRESGSAKLSNSFEINSYISLLKNLVSSLVYTPLYESFSKFIFMDRSDKSLERFDENQIIITGDSGKIIKIENVKGKTLFWFLVFSYLFRASQVIGFFSKGNNQNIPKILDLRDIARVKQEQYRQAQEIQKLSQKKDEKTNNENKIEDTDNQEEDENDEYEDESEEKEEELTEENEDVELLPENMYLPAVNGAELNKEREKDG
ncbi:MAG: hypothetical protein PHF86_12540 [Candidatus Nanoarchaeia archaeon]|nr:hypothetical protein [Candidatus Nanoarchaeia archaeon]